MSRTVRFFLRTGLSKIFHPNAKRRNTGHIERKPIGGIMEKKIVELHNDEFKLLSQFIYKNYGIKMPDSKKQMLKARLQNRLRLSGMGSFKKYYDFVMSDKTEIMHMIDVVSTNKTDFFRERAHFTFLEDVLLPENCNDYVHHPMKIWSAACSSGEEVYTIAMTINEFIENHEKFDYQIYGTDISSRMLQQAKLAVYTENRVHTISYNLKKKYLLRNVNKEKEEVRIIPGLRNKTNFKRLNLMDSRYDMPKNFDLIFCRNVLIYFDKETQERVINNLCAHLKEGAYLFLGHSESINGLNVPLEIVKPTVFRRI